MTYTTETVIHAPVEKVAGLLGNRDKMPLWMKGMEGYKHLRGEPGTVNAQTTIYLNLGTTVQVTETILAIEYPHRFSVHYAMPQGSVTITSLLQRKGRKATAYMLEHAFTFNGMLKLGAGLMKPAFIAQSNKVMNSFKEMVEAEA